MRLLLFTLLILFQTGENRFNRIARTNELKEEAQEAFEAGNYQASADLYRTLIDSFEVDSDPVRLNYANSLYKLGKKMEADAAYRDLAANATENAIKSLALQQLGVLATKDQNLEDAVTYFKQSLKADYENEGARYNYELAKKRLQKQQEQEQQNQNEQIKPSEWAKELKKRAEQLVNQNRFNDAYELMQEGLQQDPTVKAFESFISRIGTIVEIEQQ